MSCTQEPYLQGQALPGHLVTVRAGEYFDANGNVCAEGIACAKMGVGRGVVQNAPSLRPICRVAPISGIVSPLFGPGFWMEVLGVAAELASGRPFSVVAVVEPVSDLGVSVVVSACSDTLNQYRECRADLQSGIRYITKGSLATSVISRTGMTPPVAGPYVVAYCDSGTKIVAYEGVPVDVEIPVPVPPDPVPIYGTLGHISRHGGRITPDRRSDLTGGGLPIGTISPNRVIVGGSMEGSTTISGPMEGHLLALEIFAGDLTEREEWELCRAHAEEVNELAGFEAVRLCEYRTRYASTVTGDDTMGDGLFPDSAQLRPAAVQSYFGFSPDPCTLRVEAPTWAQAFTSGVRWSPSCNPTIEPYEGQRYAYFDLTMKIVENAAGFGAWTDRGNGVWSIVIDRTKNSLGATDTNIPGTPGTVGFSKLAGFAGAPHRLLRKVPAVAYQGTVQSGATSTVIPLDFGAALGGIAPGRWLKLQNEQRQIVAFDALANVATVSPGYTLAPPEATPYSVSFNDAQRVPPVDLFGWDTDPSNPAVPNSQTLYVHLPSGLNPGLFGPYVDSRAYGICNFNAPMMTCVGLVTRGAGVAGFSAGDSATSPNQLQGASMDLYDCHERLTGAGSAGGFALRGKGGRLRLRKCTGLYDANDCVNAHKNKESPYDAIVEAFDCIFGLSQDEPWSMHDGCKGYAYGCVFFGGGSGPTTSVYAPSTDVQRTFLGLTACRWWGNSQLNGGQYPGGGFSDNAPGEGFAYGCEGDAPVNIPSGASFRVAGFKLVDAANMLPPEMPPIEEIA